MTMPSMFDLPAGMNRRHFVSHLAGAAAMAAPATAFTNSLLANIWAEKMPEIVYKLRLIDWR